ncbi:MAG TPA: hypothetical protein VGN01_13270 [Acidobacteriaceae bacterium]|jgi:hypothetical protein
MLRMTRTFAGSLALLVAAAVAAPTSAHAWPLGKIFHLHANAGKAADARIDLHLFNRGTIAQDVEVNGKVYTVLPHEGLAIKAPDGTSVYAASMGLGHRKGDVLVKASPSSKGRIVYFN